MDDTLYKKLSSLAQISKAQISTILNSFPSSKDVIFQPNIIKPFERICGVTWLKSHGVCKIFKLENSDPPSTGNGQFYIIYSDFNIFKTVIDQIRSKIDPENPIKNKYHVILAPKSQYIFEEHLEQLGLFGIIQLHSLQWFPLHIDEGILSLEYPDMFKNLFVKQDYSLLPVYGKSLWQLFLACGKPKLTLALGTLANTVLSQLDLMHKQSQGVYEDSPDFSALVLLDRNVDYPSVLMTPGTYSALLNEIFSIKCGHCEYKSNQTEKISSKNTIVPEMHDVSFFLDSKHDEVYNGIKNKYFTEVTNILSTLTKQLRQEGQSSKEMKLDEIKQYVKTKLQEATSKKKLVTNHVQTAETIINILGNRFENQQYVEQCIMLNQNKSRNIAFAEELISTENNKFISLRLFCLLSCTQRLSEAETKSFWNKYLIEFGYKYGYVYGNLVNSGFLPEFSTTTNIQNKIINIAKFRPNNFYVNANKLKQIPVDPDKIDTKNPTSCSYVFGGSYLPLITIIAGMLLSNVPIEEIKMKLESLSTLTLRNERGYPIESKSILVCIIGGISYAEIAACNLLEILTESRITVLSDKVISGNDIAKGLF